MLPVVVLLDVLEHLQPHGVSGFKSPAMERLGLEAAGQNLPTDIVVAVTFSTQAAMEVVPEQKRLV